MDESALFCSDLVSALSDGRACLNMVGVVGRGGSFPSFLLVFLFPSTHF
jgi:hypothetical protein